LVVAELVDVAADADDRRPLPSGARPQSVPDRILTLPELPRGFRADDDRSRRRRGVFGAERAAGLERDVHHPEKRRLAHAQAHAVPNRIPLFARFGWFQAWGPARNRSGVCGFEQAAA
jgi:hypothetical protein